MAAHTQRTFPAHFLKTATLCRLFFSVLLIAFLSSCSFPVRTGYDRKIGGYKPTPAPIATQEATQSEAPKEATAQSAQGQQKSTQKQVTRKNSPAQVRESAKKKEVARSAPQKRTTLESAVNSWLGTRYKLGGTNKSGIDCSGYAMAIYREVYGISLDHHAESIYNDSRAKKVSRGDLHEGDLVFFGDFWGISHIGIYLKGDRFTHASTSRGVMISPMNDKYWRPKYKGARRF